MSRLKCSTEKMVGYSLRIETETCAYTSSLGHWFPPFRLMKLGLNVKIYICILCIIYIMK